jgi:hypothetical protein
VVRRCAAFCAAVSATTHYISRCGENTPKVKVNLSLMSSSAPRHEAVWGSGEPFLTWAIDVWSVSRSARLTPEKEPPLQFYRKLCGPQNRSLCCEDENNLSFLPGIEPRYLIRLLRSLVTIPTELSRSSRMPLTTLTIFNDAAAVARTVILTIIWWWQMLGRDWQ